MAGMIGRTLNEIFRVADLVGAGGFADVYLGRDLRTNTVVAIKVLHEHFTRDPKIVERFLREAKIAEVLDEPHVVRVLGSGQDDDTRYIVMEYVQGLTLADMVHRNGPMAVDEAVGYVRQMLHALGHAHLHGIIHRDIKPQNVMVVAGGQVKVMDFGIAKDVDAGGGSQTTMYLGTPRYMSPEQANGAPASPRSDLYAVTITLYELLTGQPPFSANTPWQILNLQMTAAPPPITSARSDVPVTIQQVIAKGLEKDPTRRFQSAEEMIDALDHGVPMVGEPTMIDLSPPPRAANPITPPADAIVVRP
ncbi:MAG: serine/threonine-protein kinase, partial [Candidatus Dormibacteraceae bacterium]